MGKRKVASGFEPSSDAYQRINFLYQASMHLANSVSRPNDTTRLSAYYGHLGKEVARKVVGKLHPRLKRSLCSACNHPLSVECGSVRPTVMPFNRQKMKHRAKLLTQVSASFVECSKTTSTNLMEDQMTENPPHQNKPVLPKCSRLVARERHPNRLLLKCQLCGYTKSFLQKPSHKLWINNKSAVQNQK